MSVSPFKKVVIDVTRVLLLYIRLPKGAQHPLRESAEWLRLYSDAQRKYSFLQTLHGEQDTTAPPKTSITPGLSPIS
ncbi:MAG: hypothetical protein JW709_06225 [Sedimentisphaerales bacterium]|nr:hypothetical protein [Sedimentisphaerales bacterium]